MKVVKYILGPILIVLVILGLFDTSKGIKEAMQQLKDETAVESQKLDKKRQAEFDLIKARTEWFRSRTERISNEQPTK